jgi:DNA-binding beta-propeller fold protein YncE
MQPHVRSVRTVTATLVLALALGVATHALAEFEVWALDQGTNVLYVITPDLEVSEAIALPDGIDMPHMIGFTSDHAYAFVANVASGNTAVVRASDREVVALLDTGAGTHYAGVVPGDRSVIVDVIGEAKLVELVIDLETETFEIGRELVLADDPLIAARADEFPSTSPICHDYTRDGRYAYVTLGPALADAGLVVLDVETFELVRVYPGSEIQTNCGTIASPDGRHVFLNGGSVAEGVWYVFDATTHELLHQAPSRGTDAHGVAFTNDGRELWMVNRHSSNGIVIDPVTFEVIDEIAFTGRSPDILTIGLDDVHAFVTLRGPEPRSGPHAIHGDTPGVAVLDVATREVVTVLEPDAGNPASDFHGIALRPLVD